MIILGRSTTSCPRCRGDIAVETDSYGPFIHCLMCGFMADIPKRKEPSGRHRSPSGHQIHAHCPRSKTPAPRAAGGQGPGAGPVETSRTENRTESATLVFQVLNPHLTWRTRPGNGSV